MTTTRGHSSILTVRDYAVLAAMLRGAGSLYPAIVPLLRRKLSFATVVPGNDVGPNVVTLNSRVRFRVDDGPGDERIVVHGEARGVPGMTIPITAPRGLSLLGLVEGQEVPVDRKGGPSETLFVDAVAYQPEAARAAWATIGGKEPPVLPIPVTAGNVVRLESRRIRLSCGRSSAVDEPHGPTAG
jgi:regulator of nucleoside diphosphate kinase